MFNLRQPDRRHALEFVEDWNGTRIAVVGSIAWLVSSLVGVLWSALGGNVQTSFTVAGCMLTSGTCESDSDSSYDQWKTDMGAIVILALLAIFSGVESSGRASSGVISHQIG